MIERVKETIAANNMLYEGERVAAALSGGADSVSLLLVLKELGYEVFAVHVNHNLRGEESQRDEQFCRSLCDSLGIPVFVKSVDVSAYCAEKRCSVETGARELRYEALRSAAQGCKIATAHTLSDSFETTLFNLVRGCGVRGLSGIPPVRGDIIRPLIGCTRAEVEEFLEKRGQDYVTDSTNFQEDCSRNIIRLRVVPQLERINPGLMRSFYGTSAAVRQAQSLVDEASQELYDKSFDGREYDFSGVKEGAALSGAIGKILQDAGAEPSYERISSVVGILSGGRINLKKGVYIRGNAGKLTLEYDAGTGAEPKALTLRENTQYDGKTVIVTKISPFDICTFNKDELRYLMDESKMAKTYTARHYIGNEKIRLPGRGITSTVKKLLSGLPCEERRKRLVIADGEGAVFLEGVGVSERVSCDENTVSAMKIDII